MRVPKNGTASATTKATMPSATVVPSQVTQWIVVFDCK
jgi:hypothetical protein